MSQDLRRSQLNRTAFTLAVFFVIAVGIPLVLTFTVFWPMFTQQDELPVVQAGLWLAAVIGCAILATKIVQRQSSVFAAETFDPQFRWSGLQAAPYLSNGRQYHGLWQGRAIDIYLTPKNRRTTVEIPGNHHLALTQYQGHTIDIYLEAPVRTRAAISNGIVGKGIRFSPDQNDPHVWTLSIGAGQCTISGEDTDWLRAFFAREKVHDALTELFTQEVSTSPFSIQLTPKALWLHTRVSKKILVQPRLQTWTRALEALASEAQDAEPARVQSEESLFEYTIRRNRSVWMNKIGRVFWTLFTLCMLGVVLAIYFVVRPSFG